MKNILKNFYQKFNRNYQTDFLSKKELSYFDGCKKILDLGCGEGNFVSLDRKRIIGLDHNKKSLAICRKKGLKVIFGEVVQLPFPASSFEGVRCSHLIEHLLPKEAYKMIYEIGRVLKKGGIFILSTPILWEGFYDDFTHLKPYYPKSIRRYLLYDGSQKTLDDIGYRFKEIDFYWRYRSLPFPGKIGKLISSWLFQYGIHTFKRNAYTLVLEKR